MKFGENKFSVRERFARWGVAAMGLRQVIAEDEVRFVDQGGNFESVSCPMCGKRLAIDWWQDEMDRAYESRFENLATTTPCCNSDTTLNDLKYCFDAGFSRWLVEVMNPNWPETPAGLLQNIEGVLGVGVKVIFARY